jgi:sterol 3beta-glucosyltransferase
VYVGFGSMSGRHARRRAQTVLDALAQTGQRGVLARGWGGLEADIMPDSVVLIDAVPHDWLFARVAAVVHHGGAGTTAAGLRAGRPSVICPFLGDQPFWGRVVYERGLGPRPIPQRRLTAARLATAIATAVHDAAIRDRATAMGTAIRAEDGVGQIVALVNQLLPAPRPARACSALWPVSVVRSRHEPKPVSE